MNAWVLAIVSAALQSFLLFQISRSSNRNPSGMLSIKNKFLLPFVTKSTSVFCFAVAKSRCIRFNGVSASCPRDLEVSRTIIVAALSLSLFQYSIAASVSVTTLVRPRFRDGIKVEVCDGVKVLVLGPRFSSSDSRYLLALNCCSYSPTQPFQSISLFQFESDVIFVPVSFLSLSASVLQIAAYQFRLSNQVFHSSSVIPKRACLQDCPAVPWHEQLSMCYIKEFRNFGQECCLVLLSWGPTRLRLLLYSVHAIP